MVVLVLVVAVVLVTRPDVEAPLPDLNQDGELNIPVQMPELPPVQMPELPPVQMPELTPDIMPAPTPDLTPTPIEE